MQPGGQQQTDQTANFFWLLCIICGAFIIFWWVDEKYVVAPIFFIRDVEIDVVRWLALLWMPIAKLFHLPLPNLDQLDALETYTQQADPAQVSWTKFAAINAEFGQWVRYPVMVVLLGLAVFAILRRGGQFQHQYDMKSLRVVGQEVWPQITHIISLDLVKADIDT